MLSPKLNVEMCNDVLTEVTAARRFAEILGVNIIRHQIDIHLSHHIVKKGNSELDQIPPIL